jgi:hypothetical protein
MVPPDSNGVSRAPPYSGTLVTSLLAFRVRDSHPLRCDVPVAFCYAFESLDQSPTTPERYYPLEFGLIPFRSPLLRESRLISFPPGTEMFQFPGLALFRVMGFNTPTGFPIRKSPDQSLLAAPRGLSQLATSFIAGSCLGIHRVHLIT